MGTVYLGLFIEQNVTNPNICYFRLILIFSIIYLRINSRPHCEWVNEPYFRLIIPPIWMQKMHGSTSFIITSCKLCWKYLLVITNNIMWWLDWFEHCTSNLIYWSTCNQPNLNENLNELSINAPFFVVQPSVWLSITS